ncbi:M48 family metallopeptidase [Luteitalea sp.]|uniref:M48 family metallopeptidase n=1 Tax=Luteitalea sp. TaxID=2004800 RepID=UPI0025B8B3E7|nr:M48 family metallopeptidase [Luteitalea sp.]
MAASTLTFHNLIAENRRNSLLLVVLFCLFTAIVAAVFGLAIVGILDPERLARLDWTQGLLIGGIAAGISLLLSIISYYGGDRMILAVSHARPIQHDDDPELFNVVEEMAIAAGAPMPGVYVIDDSAPNAFATGRDPRHAAITVTSGLRTKLTRDELQGVVAHEMSHIGNYDIRLMLLMAVLIGTVVMLSDFLWQTLFWSSVTGGRRRSRDESGGNPIALVLVVFAVLLGILAPLLARIIQLAVSREREYLADASAVELTRYPEGLASALRKIDGDPEVLESANRGTAHLFIANPIKKFEERAGSVFASHPPIGERIRRLESLTR